MYESSCSDHPDPDTPTSSSCLFLLCRDQPGDSSKSSGYCQHTAVPPDAQVLEGKAPGFKETGWKQNHQIYKSEFNLYYAILMVMGW